MNVKTLNIMIADHNDRIMWENDFTALYMKVHPGVIDIIRLVYTRGWPIPGECDLNSLLQCCDKIIKRIS